MRAIIKTGTLLFIYMFISITSVMAGVDGYYYNPRLHESIRIIEQNRDIIIKGLFNDNRITRFEKVSRNTYEDRYGNILLCEDRNTVKLKRWRSRDYIRFDKVDDRRGRDDWNRYHDYNDDCDIHDYNKYDDRYRDQYDNRYNDRNDDRYNKNNKSNNGRYGDRDKKDKDRNKEYRTDSNYDYNNRDYKSTNLSALGSTLGTAKFVGTWDVRNGGYNSVAIIDTREGLKAKFSGTTSWVDYTQSQSRPNEYLDERGNRYIFDRDDEGKWFPADKDKKVIELRKISNEVKY